MELIFKEIQRRKDIRALSLLLIYFESSKGKLEFKRIDAWDIKDQLQDYCGIDCEYDEVRTVIEFLEKEHLVDLVGNTGYFKLSHNGLKKVEEFLESFFLSMEDDLESKTHFENLFGDIIISKKESKTNFIEISNSVKANLISQLIIDIPRHLEKLNNLF